MNKIDRPIYTHNWIQYLKENELTKADRIFQCDSRYEALIEALEERDWHHNESMRSEVFHIKFCVSTKHIFRNQKGTTSNAVGKGRYELQDF